ncbi:K(+)-transporting ATPase subunit F [Acidithiobacillus caldus ATCC 51756]|uniref:K+-transporting ATPase subunit F n=2 Tax=Acidithiobacillus caldus TaxID=33059 RepID=F9ZPN7_ACICS|nr:K(+)-transporting ATPase subunit F [Acidithiobacillus caldus]MBU2734728.1 K(+)-transporting ATPase subunit F [Acidithiobacillus caldus ATCC 51756]AEK56787.1 hypothetical protein Atc_0136 [Acidithiobacillus caldus SM-1]MBU2730684.1 K(+)-transporting ATPase subunit F [Acidithiobacillus caldus]MBU2744433.1 K(+)-transporting ATPase subunit F [Acidithiobacillus caldus]MBU2779039.1 K(+)-transporting ATPase subunit F [Acidithiobacillus caldus]
MSPFIWIGLGLGVFLFGYLLVFLIFPERFL